MRCLVSKSEPIVFRFVLLVDPSRIHSLTGDELNLAILLPLGRIIRRRGVTLGRVRRWREIRRDRLFDAHAAPHHTRARLRLSRSLRLCVDFQIWSRMRRRGGRKAGAGGRGSDARRLLIRWGRALTRLRLRLMLHVACLMRMMLRRGCRRRRRNRLCRVAPLGRRRLELLRRRRVATVRGGVVAVLVQLLVSQAGVLRLETLLLLVLGERGWRRLRRLIEVCGRLLRDE